MYLRAGTTLSMATVAPLFPPPLIRISQLQQFGGIGRRGGGEPYMKSPRWTFLHRGKSVSELVSYPDVQIFHLPVKVLLLTP